jgi:NAD(P)-dependent dehydrogenase (short-subunit alcohol dehydrogenase family)
MSDGRSKRPAALVTGAARGIGRACALALGRAGFDIAANDREDSETRDLLRQLEQELAALGAGCEMFCADIAELATHAGLVRTAAERWGRVDCLVSNAGAGVLRRGDLLEVTPESFDRCIAVNTRAAFFLTQAVARHLLQQGEICAQHRSIIHITSSNAAAVSVSRGEYCVSKAASSMTAKLYGLRLAEAGIGVYEVRPGIIETAMTMPAKERYDAMIADGLVPAGRWGYPDDVASTVTAMAEGRLRYTVGQAVTVDGGLTMPHF